MVRSIIAEMLEELGTMLTKRSVESMVKNILNMIVKRGSVAELVNELVRNLPIELSEDKISVVETSAEKLYCVEEPEVSIIYELVHLTAFSKYYK